MALTPGTRLGSYEIIAPIGAGGMGEVYRAKDTKLNRDVAIKVLPESFALDADRVARFTREAQVLASLNHPNIAAIYGIEEQGSTRALVMELVEGEDLSEIIARHGHSAPAAAGPSESASRGSAARGGGAPRAMSIDDALPIATQIADALEAAHEQGIIHRDLKPANVKVRTDGTVKVLDFGLAKAMDPAGASSVDVMNSPTLTARATQMGMILGTAAYMSPEQAKGKSVDKRADIWAFGVVLYEMLSGQRAFKGDDISETLASVLKDTTSMDALPRGTPPRLTSLIARCLDRDLKTRLRDIGEARIEIARIEAGGPDSAIAPARAITVAPLWRRALPWAIAAALAVALAELGVWHFREAPPAAPLVQTEMPLPEGVVRSGYGGISPDGTRVVDRGTPQGGRPQLYLRSLSGRAFAPIPGTENAEAQAFWSPDSEWIAFGADGKLMKWNVTAGQPPQMVCNADAKFGTWSEDGVILFSEPNKPIQRVPAAGGAPRDALELDTAFGEESHINPYFLPGGNAFLFKSNGKVRGADFFATLDGRVRRHLFENLNSPSRYVTNPSGGGFLVYDMRSQLFARPFNPATGELLGEAVLLVDGVAVGPSFSFGGPGFLVYPPTRIASTQLRWYGGDGKPGETLGEPGELGSPRVSPDGKRVLYYKTVSGQTELWLSGEGGGAGERILSATVGDIGSAIRTPEGHILYSRREAQGSVVVERPADALGAESILARMPGNTLPMARSISANGKVVALSAGGGGKAEAFVLSRPGGQIRPANLPPQVLGLALSPDGKWLAYVTGGVPPFRVVVRAVPDDAAAPLPPGERELASIPTVPAGNEIRWSADGKELHWLMGPTPPQHTLMSLPIVWSDGTPRAGALRKLFDTPRAVAFDETAAGRRFIVAESVGENTATPMILIQNWPALLRK